MKKIIIFLLLINCVETSFQKTTCNVEFNNIKFAELYLKSIIDESDFICPQLICCENSKEIVKVNYNEIIYVNKITLQNVIGQPYKEEKDTFKILSDTIIY